MKTFAIFENVHRGASFERKYLAFCNDERNLSPMPGIADFKRKDGTYTARSYVHFSSSKAAIATIAELDLPCVEVDDCGYCEINI